MPAGPLAANTSFGATTVVEDFGEPIRAEVVQIPAARDDRRNISLLIGAGGSFCMTKEEAIELSRLLRTAALFDT